MNVKSLETAVLEEIDAFMANDCEFSAHSVTVNIRTKVNSGNLEIDGLSQDTIGGITTQKIEHHIVRNIIYQQYNGGSIQNRGYDRRWQVAPNANGGYFVYGPVNVTSTQVPQASVAPVQSAMTSQSSPANQSVVKSVLNYFDNRFADGVPATLKSTQSRLKRSPLLVTDIAQIAVSNGYLVVPVPGKSYSRSIVKPGSQKVVAGTVSSH
jgi:hypothetical protein